MGKLDGFRVAAMMTDGFEQVELTRPRKALEDEGATVKILAPGTGKVQGLHHIDKGEQFEVDLELSRADPDDFDGILLPGGVVNADALRVDEDAQSFVKAFSKAGKPIAVICHGPWLLVSTGLLKGKTITSYHTVKDDIRNAGGHWVDEEMRRDGNIVSSRKPDDIPKFNEAMIELFAESR